MGGLSYVYMVFRPNGVPLYVGKGTGDRWQRHIARAARNPHYKHVLDRAGGSLPCVIVASGLTERQAFALEELFSRAIGIESEGGPLVNCGHGGSGGPTGVKRSKEWRAHRRLVAIEQWKNEAFRKKMLRPDRKRSGNKQPRTAEFKTAIARKLKGNKHTLGYKHSSATRSKMRSRWRDPVWRANELARRRATGLYSPEMCAKRWAARKANSK